MKVDLHMHSNNSDDGDLTVEQIIDLAKKENIATISITDHNSVNGIHKAKKYGVEKGVDVISGIEIDCTFNGLNLHLLGYGFDYSQSIFNKIYDDIFKQEIENASKKIKLIRENTDLIVDEDEILKLANGGIVTGELIGEVIISDKNNHKSKFLAPYLEGGEKDDMPYVHFYWDYFSQGKIAYTHMQFLSLQDAIKIIKDAGGIAVIAHPGNNLKNNKNLIFDLIREGIDGIEVYSSYHSLEDTQFFKIVAEENNLLITCGTDFHGKNKPKINLGAFKEEIEFEKILTELKNKLRS